MSTFSQHLTGRGEHGLAALLRVRPDLAAPAPASVRSLAARAANRASVERALAGLDALVLAVLEATLALEGATRRSEELTVADLATAMGLDVGRLAEPVLTALGQALLWTETAGADALRGSDAARPPDHELAALTVRAAPGLDDVLGPYPAGLGPPLASSLARRTPQTLARLATDIGIGVGRPAEGSDTDALIATLVPHLADPATVGALLDRAPTGARAVLEALAWGPPVGRSPAGGADRTGGPARGAVDWLVRHGLLAVGDPQHVVLPREVALALRGGRTHRQVPTPPAPEGSRSDPRTVEAESARQAEEVVRLVEGVVHAWSQEQPPVLRSGGLGARELRRLATRLDVPEATAALVAELAGAAGLVADDAEEPPTFTPTTDADEWLRLALPDRWVALTQAWLASERAAWLVGTRDERGNLRAALDPDLRRPWAPRLRTTVLHVLADAGSPDEPHALAAPDVHDVLRWRTPRAAPAQHAVEAVLREAGLLGLLGAGALSTVGLAALTDPATAAAVLAEHLPPAVDEVLLQGDLTGIVPGRPSPALAELLGRAAQVESRGAGVTVRFTEASVRNALDGGTTAEDLLAELSQLARSGVPQPLEYLVLDTARRHGQVRVGAASSYLRADDPTLLAGLVEDRLLRGLGLLRLAPTVIAAQAPVAAVLAALRDRGLAPVTEDAGGHVVVLRPAPRRVRSP
ncbi:MAG: hypothetical protein JWP95_519, partial [Actinotalea sp.]|nr:hypothetical protein [Actinotalea sp.]